MNVLDTLIAARKVIERPEDWNQHSVHYTHEGHTTRCSRGAILQIIGPETSEEEELPFAEALVPHMPFGGQLGGAYSEDAIGHLCEWNNSHTHAEVLAAFDQAIEAARAAV